MASFGFLQRFLMLHIAVWGREKLKKQAFVRIIKELKKEKNGIYDPVRNRLTREFAEAVLALSGIAGRMLPVYRKTLTGNPDDRKKAETGLIEKVLQAFQLDLGSFRFEALSEEVLRRQGKGIRELDTAFKERLEVFKDDRFKHCCRGYGLNLRMAGLCAFDFISLLEPFRTSGAPLRGFSSCSAPRVMENLMDLYFLIHGLESEEAAETVFSALTEQAAADSRGPEEIHDDMENMKTLLAGPLECGRLALIIRCIMENPALELKTETVAADPLEDLTKSLVEEYRSGRHELIRIWTERSFQSRLHALFGERTLAVVEGYTPENSTLLFEAGLPEFRYMEPMRILKNFSEVFYKPIVHPAFQSFFLEAEFSDADFSEDLHEAVEGMGERGIALERFEKEMAIFSFSKIQPTIDLMQGGLADHASKAKAVKVVEKINEEADRIIQDYFAILTRLRTGMEKIRIDILAHGPELLRNTSFLKSKRPQLVTELERGVELLEKALRLLRMFSVDLEATKKDLHKPG